MTAASAAVALHLHRRCTASDSYVAAERRIPLHLLKRIGCALRPLSVDAVGRRPHFFAVLLLLAALPGAAQSRNYGGVLAGVSTLSGDARSAFEPPSSSFSLYDPKNGLAFSAFAGRDISEYVSLQGNFIWNRNQLSLTSGASVNGALTEYEELRGSSQQGGFADALIYFRSRESRFRPYLSVGTGLVHFSSTEERVTKSTGMPILPLRTFSSNFVALHVPVGIDVKIGKGWAVRYAFSETLGKNPVSERLSPPGMHRLMNFQNFFGVVRRF